MIVAGVVKPRSLIFTDNIDRLPPNLYRIQDGWSSVEAVKKSILVLEHIGIHVVVDCEGYEYETPATDSPNA